MESTKHAFKLNYVFQKEDTRDLKLKKVKDSIDVNSYSLKSKIKTIYNQGEIGSCVSNAFAQYINMCTINHVFISRLLHYYCGRAIEGDSSADDTGLEIRQAASIIKKYGACDEKSWVYDTKMVSVLPPLDVFKQSLLFKKYTYTFASQRINDLLTILYVKKLPIIFGFNVYESFTSGAVAKTGIVPMPDVSTEKSYGGHCMVIIGFDKTTQLFTCVNSWGTSWGNGGFCYMPFAYILDSTLASDFCYIDFVF